MYNSRGLTTVNYGRPMISKSYFTHKLFISLISKIVRRIITNPQNVDRDFLHDLSLVAPCVPRLPRVLSRRFSSLISSFARGYALMLCPRLHNHPVSTCKMNRNTIGCHYLVSWASCCHPWMRHGGGDNPEERSSSTCY